MNILDYALAKKLFGGSGSGEVSGTIDINENGTYNVAKYAHANVNVASSGGGESGVPIKVAELPTPTAEDIGKVYLNTTDGNYYVGEQAAGGSLAVGEPLGDKINFDTSVNIADLGVPAGGFVPVLSAQSDSAGFGIVIGETLGGDTGTCYIVMCGDIYSDDPSSANIVYVQSDALTVDQFNEMLGSQIGLTITEFGWQTDVLDTSAYADCIVQENYLSEAGNFAFIASTPSFEIVNKEHFEDTIATLEAENNSLQNQYNEAHRFASWVENTAELYIPDGTTLEEEGILSKCTKLTKLSLPSLDGVNDGFFKLFGNQIEFVPKSLETVEIREGAIGDYAFRFNSLKTINLGDGVTSIGEVAFGQCSLISINIPDSVTSIGTSAFIECRNLASSIVIPNSVTSISNSTFHGCYNIPSITIPNSVTSIGRSAFYECRSLTSITIPDGVTSIEYNTFYGCTSLTSITIPYGVTSIAVQAFRNCEVLGNITVKAITPPTLGVEAFTDCPALTAIYVPAESVEAYKSATNWSAYADIIQPIVE